MPRPDDIIEMIDRRETNRSALQRRMDQDFDRYNLEPYQGERDENGKPILDGYKKFTSNDPCTSMNLALHLLSTAPVLIRVRKPKAQKKQRETDNDKELFALGIWQAADLRRADLMAPSLQDALGAMALIRGRTAQRVLLVKEDIDERPPELEQAAESIRLLPIPPEDRAKMEEAVRSLAPKTRTFVDIQDWDPRNTYWAMGKHGLKWACNKSWKTAEDIEAEWGVKLEAEGVEDITRVFAVYDYLDEEHNQVLVDEGQDDHVLKQETPHGMGRVPVDIRLVGGLPLFQANGAEGGGRDYEVHYGESFYQADREMFDQQNFILSILAELSKRSIAQGLLVYSQDGKMTLESDPRETGAETSLKTGQEDIKALPPMEMVASSATFMGVVSQMVQRGTFPSSVYGELAFQLSGFAVKLLQQGQAAPIGPSAKTVATAMRGILNILADAYVTGNFDTMTLSGRMQDVERTDFEQEFAPEMVKVGGLIEVELVPQLPQDDQAKAVLAQTLASGPVPLVDHRFIREHILQLQDVGAVERAVQEQLAATGSPAALAFSNMLAAAESGDNELAQIWFVEFQIQMTQRLLAMQQGKAATAAPSSNGNRPGISASDVPGPIQGIPTPEPTPQAGPLVPPGTPRNRR